MKRESNDLIICESLSERFSILEHLKRLPASGKGVSMTFRASVIGGKSLERGTWGYPLLRFSSRRVIDIAADTAAVTLRHM
jgi:hypothetical protein